MARKIEHIAQPPATDDSDPLFGAASAAVDTLAKAGVLTPSTELAPGTFTEEAKTTIARRGFEEVQRSTESTAVGEQVKAEIAARTIHAMNHPRSFAEARVRILADCKRPAFAKAAIFRKPVGGGAVEGLSIRFAESALRHWGNVASQAVVLYDGADKRVVRIGLTDLESNTTHSRDIVLIKTVERSVVKPGQEVLRQRLNSKGNPVFEVLATEDELATKEAAARSKVMRNEGLRLIPADILDEAMAECRKTRASDDAADPAAAQKAVADAFATLNIMPTDIAEYLGCEIGQASPAQVNELREWYVAVREGDATWREILAARVGDLQNEDEEEQKAPRTVSLKEKAKANAEARRAKAAEGKEKKS